MQNADRPDRPAIKRDASFQRLEAATSRLIQPLQKMDFDAEMQQRTELAMQEPERWDGMS